MQRTGGLGKGLSALIQKTSVDRSVAHEGYVPNMPVEQIIPNRYQPRIEIKDQDLIELMASIKEHGIIEPLLVTKQKGKDIYELIAGERRWRAAKLAKLPFVPVVIKEASPQDMLEMAVIENVQRADLNPLEEALAFEQLVKLFNLTHEEISIKIGVSRPAIANKIRLLSLPEEIKKALLEEKITEGHARALLGLQDKENMLLTFKLILKDHLSVRAVEELVRRLNKGKQIRTSRKQLRIYDEETTMAEKTLRERYGEKVILYKTQRGGKIIIPFRDEIQYEKLIKLLTDT